MTRWLLIAIILTGGRTLRAEVGINLAGVAYYSTEYPFVDVFRLSQPFMSQKRGTEYGQGGPLELRDDGYPKRLVGGSMSIRSSCLAKMLPAESTSVCTRGREESDSNWMRGSQRRSRAGSSWSSSPPDPG